MEWLVKNSSLTMKGAVSPIATITTIRAARLQRAIEGTSEEVLVFTAVVVTNDKDSQNLCAPCRYIDRMRVPATPFVQNKSDKWVDVNYQIGAIHLPEVNFECLHTNRAIPEVSDIQYDPVSDRAVHQFGAKLGRCVHVGLDEAFGLPKMFGGDP